jgi:hypothetical protein
MEFTPNLYNGTTMFSSFKPDPLAYRDLWVALITGIVFAVISSWIIAPQVMFSEHLEPFLAPNFGEYCEVLGLWTESNREWKIQALRRSMAGSVPAHLFVNSLGVLDGLAAGALLCAAVLGASIYIWARSLGGTLAGIMSVATALSTGTLCLITRHFTFYPTIVACFALTAALCAGAARVSTRTLPLALFFSATAVGASLLVDVRGVIWAAPMLVLLLWLVTRIPGWRGRLLGLFLVITPLLVSHSLGEWNSGGMKVVTLEEQVDVRPLAYLHGARGPGQEPPFTNSSGFFWGVSSLSELPKTAQFLVQQMNDSSVSDVVDVRSHETRLFEEKVEPWERGSLVALIIVLLSMRKDPRGMLVLLLTGAPYVAAQLGIHAHHEVRVRFLLQTLPLLAVLYGIAASHLLALLLQIVGHTQDTPRAKQAQTHPRQSPLWPAMGGVLVLLCTANSAGFIPGPLHMNASWRGGPWHFVNGHISLYKRMVEEHQTQAVLNIDPWENNEGSTDRWVFREATCNPLLYADQQRRGGAFESGLYPPLQASTDQPNQPDAGFAPGMPTQRPE